MSFGYIPGNLDTSDGLTKAMYSASLGSLLGGNKFRIVTEIRKAEIRKRLPASELYIVCLGAIQGRKDSNVDMRRQTRVGRSPHWQIAMGGKASLNSNKLHRHINSKIATAKSKTESNFAKIPKYD